MHIGTPWARRHTRVTGPVLSSAEGSAKVIQVPRGTAERNADVAQLVAHHLAKVRVASSSLVIRSSRPGVFGSRASRYGTVHFRVVWLRWIGREARQRPAK